MFLRNALSGGFGSVMGVVGDKLDLVEKGGSRYKYGEHFTRRGRRGGFSGRDPGSAPPARWPTPKKRGQSLPVARERSARRRLIPSVSALGNEGSWALDKMTSSDYHIVTYR